MRTALLQHEHDASQSGHETQPSSRYTVCGLDGMLEGRFPVLRHASHCRVLPSLSFRAIALALVKGSIGTAESFAEHHKPGSWVVAAVLYRREVKE